MTLTFWFISPITKIYVWAITSEQYEWQSWKLIDKPYQDALCTTLSVFEISRFWVICPVQISVSKPYGIYSINFSGGFIIGYKRKAHWMGHLCSTDIFSSFLTMAKAPTSFLILWIGQVHLSSVQRAWFNPNANLLHSGYNLLYSTLYRHSFSNKTVVIMGWQDLPTGFQTNIHENIWIKLDSTVKFLKFHTLKFLTKWPIQIVQT